MRPIRFRPRRSRRRLASLSLAAALLWAVPALAGDKPATPEGADALRALIAKYLPAAQAGATPLVTVKPDGSHYLVSVDLSALNALLADREESDVRMDALRGALSVLNARERRIFEARRLADDPITLEELSAEFGVSRERVRQIEVRAFEKVQQAVKAGVAKAQAPKNRQPAALPAR
jgi:DNA-directed RNA polymerase specialized sigma24 family protein